jgi:hypothetical protein
MFKKKIYLLFIFLNWKWTNVHQIIYLFSFIFTTLFLKLKNNHCSITINHSFSKGRLNQSVHINWRVCPFWLKVWGMKNTCYIWPVYLTKMTFLIDCQAKDLFKVDKCPSKWPWLSQINHIEWIGFSQIDHFDLALSQINHYDWHLVKWAIFVSWLSLFVKRRLLT